MIINISSGCESCVHVKQYEGLSDCNRILGDTPKNNHLSALGGGFAVRSTKSGGLALPREPSCAGGGGGGLFRVSATLFLFLFRV